MWKSRTLSIKTCLGLVSESEEKEVEGRHTDNFFYNFCQIRKQRNRAITGVDYKHACVLMGMSHVKGNVHKAGKDNGLGRGGCLYKLPSIVITKLYNSSD